MATPLTKDKESKILNSLTFLDIELSHVQRDLRNGFPEKALKSAEQAKQLVEAIISNLQPKPNNLAGTIIYEERE